MKKNKILLSIFAYCYQFLHIVDKYNYRQYLRSDFNSMSYSIT